MKWKEIMQKEKKVVENIAIKVISIIMESEIDNMMVIEEIQ